MAKPKGDSFGKVFEKFSKDPAFLKAKRAVNPFFQIVENVVAKRIELGLSQKDLAARAKTHQSRISKIESGEHDIRLSTLISIAEALDCEVCIQFVPFSSGKKEEDSQYLSLFMKPIKIGGTQPETVIHGTVAFETGN